MNYVVEWLPSAEEELAAIWLEAIDRRRVNKAAQRIEAELRRAPFDLGESRSLGVRVTFDAPLGILFRPRLRDRVVQVVQVWTIR